MRHLRKVDPRLCTIIDRVGPCLLEPHPHRFSALVRSIVSQQISTKAAQSINCRLMDAAGDPYQPARLIELGELPLRGAGLSGQKARYVLNVADAVASGRVPLDAIDDSWDDQAVIKSLTTIKGVGVWTAEMFLIFVLNRPDVLPSGDLGVRAALRIHHDLPDLPKPSECPALAEAWRPYRTIASWYIWRGIDTKGANKPPVQEKAKVPASRSTKSR